MLSKKWNRTGTPKVAVVGNFHLNSPLPKHRLSFVLSEHRLHFANIARIDPGGE